MSFSIEVKEEITRVNYTQSEKKAILSAICKIDGTINIISKKLQLNVRTENAKIAKMLFVFIKDLYEIELDIIVSKKEKLKKNNVYVININDKSEEIMSDLEIYQDGLVDIFPTKNILLSDNEKKAYIAGCFLASGSVNSPFSKNYHLEVFTQSEDFSNFISKLINKNDLNSKVIKRRNKFVVYLKKSEEISDFLRICRANQSVMYFEEERISKDYFNSNNRLNICEISNDLKSIESANKQLEEIEFIVEKNKSYLLSEKEKEIMQLRLENKDASLNELAEILEEKTGIKISKSGINHRFRGISKIYQKIKNEE